MSAGDAEERAMNDDDILAALKEVIDPELGLNIVDLGLVHEIIAKADRILVALMMTTPACPLGEMLVEQAEAALLKHFPTVELIDVMLRRDLPWSPELMTEDGRRQLGLTPDTTAGAAYPT
ncbi:MAG: metal-sulfur cluster assembly factor [Bradyrhizobiaceae bacterium]|nr:metal-sulfur cluster assembly factor [Bradyrhizobiaceae bacterium]